MIEDLIAASAEALSLEDFISENFEEIQDYFNWNTDNFLEENKSWIQGFITGKRRVLLNLPPTEKNLAFLALLLDISERMGLINGFQYLFRHLQGKGYNVGSRLIAASYYLIGADRSDAYVSAYDSMYELLQESYLNEEDNADKVLTTLTNYYSKAVLDFGRNNINVARQIAEKITKSIAADEYSVLSNPLVYDILATDLSNFRDAHLHIRSLLDQYLRRGHYKGTITDGFVIESDTPYSRELDMTERNFSQIRQLSVQKHNREQGGQGIFESLYRGVRILEEERQLHAYMTGFGPMHSQKLVSAFGELPDSFYSKKINIIDWGCGQAMGSMCFLEYCQQNDIHMEIETILLIEPSTIALKRGALHVRKYLDCNLITVNKGLDDLSIEDIAVGSGINLHLFSNILDIEKFSLARLTNLIKSSYGGKNYFIAVSPYVDDTKKARINSFVRSFSNFRNFEIHSQNTQGANEWISTWTRISRIFSTDLNFNA